MANLLPISIKKRIAKHYRMRVLSIFVLMVAAVSLIALTLLAPSALMVQEKYNQYKHNLNKSGIEREVYVNSQRVIEEAEAKMGILKEQYTIQKVSSDIFDMLLKHKTENVSVKVLTYARINTETTPVYARVVLSGVARNRQSLIKFEQDLKNERLVLSVSNPIEGLAEKENLSFSMNIEIGTDESLAYE